MKEECCDFCVAGGVAAVTDVFVVVVADVVVFGVVAVVVIAPLQR